MRALLDVNVLIALLDTTHIHHTLARNWFAENHTHGWASCPLTENGCLRIISQPNYSNSIPVKSALEKLNFARRTPLHAFWPDDVSLLDFAAVNIEFIHGPKQLTDIYLLALAVKNGGRLISFDRKIPLSAVHRARAEHLVII